MTASRPIFLSSCFTDPTGIRLRLRDRIQATIGKSKLSTEASQLIWMAEDFAAFQAGSPLGDLEKTALCLEGVRQAECFVAVMTSRHGSRISVEGAGEVPTSFFEAELFEAALLGKPSFIFLLDGYEPEGRLAGLLKVLEPSFPNMDLTPRSEDEILRRLDRLAEHYQRPRWLRRLLVPPRLERLVDTQVSLRHRPYDPISSPPPLRFLETLSDPAVGRPDLGKVEALLDRASAEPAHQLRLTLVWFAIRALMGAPFDDPTCRDAVPLWDRAFRTWISNGAWYGLHSHFPMSCLAALGSLTDLRMSSIITGAQRSGLPHGSLASEYYSIAKLAGHADRLLGLALEHIELAVGEAPDAAGNQFAIRGSILLQLGRTDAALNDFRAVVDARREQGGPAYGEALSEFGYAMLRAGQPKRGLEKMEKGLELLQLGPPSGFQVRAMRKLALGYARCWKPVAALDLAADAYGVAEEIGAYDQMRQLGRLFAYLHKRRHPDT
jgi:tetratricopeptide (TPR) repeat protein